MDMETEIDMIIESNNKLEEIFAKMNRPVCVVTSPPAEPTQEELRLLELIGYRRAEDRAPTTFLHSLSEDHVVTRNKFGWWSCGCKHDTLREALAEQLAQLDESRKDFRRRLERQDAIYYHIKSALMKPEV